MGNLFLQTDARMVRRHPLFPTSLGKPRFDGWRVLSGTTSIDRNAFRWRDALNEHGPAMTLYNRWKRWSGAPWVRECPRKCMEAPRAATSLREKGSGQAAKGVVSPVEPRAA